MIAEGTMIKELTWDSELLGRKIGKLTVDARTLSSLGKALKKAEREGYRYILCRLRSQDAKVIRALESEGFYLTDIGVTFGIESGMFTTRRMSDDPVISRTIAVATDQDIPGLQRLIPSLFPESRFYHDKFYSREDADRLYREWIANSVKGTEADIVFHVPRTGFITCCGSGKKSGKIVLFGVKKSSRGKGYGSALLGRSMDWFSTQGIGLVTVRTQLRNLSGMNFYLRSGFAVKEYDLMFARIL